MGKFFKIAGIIGAVIVAYLITLPMWPIVYNAAFDAATSTNATANAYEYRATTAFLRFSPLLLFLVPAVIGIVSVFIVLKKPAQEQR